jgi:hypothetical protein
MSVCCECCVLSGRGLYDGLINRPEESYLFGVSECDREASRTGRPRHGIGRRATVEKKREIIYGPFSCPISTVTGTAYLCMPQAKQDLST